MFEDSLIESSGALRRRNPWSAAASFVVQAMLAAVLVLLPLIYTQALPWRQFTGIVTAPAPPPAAAPPAAVHTRTSPAQPLPRDGILHIPSVIPRRVAMLHDDEAIAGGGGAPDALGVQGGVGFGVPGSIISNVIQPAPVLPKVAAPAKMHVSSGVAQGLLIHQVKPNYPSLAVQARIQGTVVLQAVIGKDGMVRDLRVVSGHPLLVQAALEAVKQWRYRPYLLNDQPVEVDTQVNVKFTLGSP